jgi:transcriptional regulator with XRE-family HTH domain
MENSQSEQPVIVGRTPLGIHLSALDAWAKEKDLSTYAIAKILGCSINAVKLWRQGQSLPNVIYACYIERLTGGAVPVQYWMTTPLGLSMQTKTNQFWVLREKKHRAVLRRKANARKFGKIRRRKLANVQPKANQDPSMWEPEE